MKAQELRIGNWVYQQSSKMVKEDVYTAPYKIQTINSQTGFKYQPIPLTEEILLKSGFVECEGKYGEYYKHKCSEGFRIWYFENEQTNCWVIGAKDYDLNETFVISGNKKHLHQLQNLYFALTNQELEIKL